MSLSSPAQVEARKPPPIAARSASRRLRVASYNIHKCIGRDRRRDPGRIIRVLAELEADVVALQEAERRFGRSKSLIDAKTLLQETGYTALRPGFEPCSGHVCGWYGNAILVREGIGDATWSAIALPSLEPRGAVVAEIGVGHQALRIVATHFGLVGRWRRKQAAAIVRYLAKTKSPSLATIMLGDLNEWMPSARSMRVLESFFGHSASTAPSFPSSRPLLALDRIFVSPHSYLGAIRVHDTPAARSASDHLPVTAVIDMPGDVPSVIEPAEVAC